MPRFAANLSTLFTDLPLPERITAAKEVGFKGVEMQYPYHVDAARLADLVACAELSMVLFNTPPGDWEAGERGLAALPGREQEFRDNLELALHYAELLECPRLHVMAGLVDDDDIDAAFDTYVANLAYAADEAQAHDVKILIEPINPVDMPGYFLTRPEDALTVLEAVDHKNLFLQYDLYHAQMVQGGLTDFLEANMERIAHMQVASVPGRHEPDTNSEINHRYLFNLIDAHGYGGWIGCEYKPRIDTRTGLRWAKEWGIG